MITVEARAHRGSTALRSARPTNGVASSMDAILRRCLVVTLAAGLAACTAGPRTPGVSGDGTAAEAAGSAEAAGASTARPGAGPAQVAILLPLGASDQRAARSAAAILKAAELAISGPDGAALRLRSYDTKGTPDGATVAAEAAMADGARLILGPLFGRSAQAVGAAAGGVPVLSFSTDTSVAAGNVWVTGFAPENEVERILSFAAAQGIGSVAVYAPDVPYGAAALRGLGPAASATGVSVVAEEVYPRSFQDIERTAPLFVSTAQAGGAQAVLLPDFGQGLAIAASFVNFHGMPQPEVRYLGIGQWEAGETLRAPELVGGWFAGADSDAVAAFFQRYQTRYGERPPFVAVLGYDAGLIAATLASEGRAAGSADPFSRSALTRSVGFEGAVGALRLREDGRTDRGLAVLEVSDGRFVVLDPAPRRFDVGS